MIIYRKSAWSYCVRPLLLFISDDVKSRYRGRQRYTFFLNHLLWRPRTFWTAIISNQKKFFYVLQSISNTIKKQSWKNSLHFQIRFFLKKVQKRPRQWESPLKNRRRYANPGFIFSTCSWYFPEENKPSLAKIYGRLTNLWFFFGIHKKKLYFGIFFEIGVKFLLSSALNVEVIMETPVLYFARIVNVFMEKISPLWPKSIYKLRTYDSSY